ncbi:DMT family transporter [Aestuariivirga sp.]|uniref:DMT family transporter n=1 Tax=Aestuariivirga sp. TaxID=2650926 RepID=UPI003BAC16DA
MRFFSPVEQITLQLFSAIAISSIMVVVFRLWRRLSLREVLIIGLCGIFEPGLTYLFGQHGLQLTDAGIVSVIFSSEAVVTVLLLALLRIEAITPMMFGLAAMAFAGVLLVVGADVTGGPRGSAFGYGLLALSVIMASLYAIISTAFAVRGDVIFLVLIQQIFALGLLGAYSAITGATIIPHIWSQIPPAQWVNLIICGAAQFSVAFAVFQLALRASPYRAVVFLNLIPLIGLLAGYVVLDETLLASQALGVAITICALTMIAKHRTST